MLGYNNYLIVVDLSQDWDWKINISEVAYNMTMNPVTGTFPPQVIDGVLYQGRESDPNIYLYGGTTSSW